MQHLLTDSIKSILPRLYATQDTPAEEKVAVCKFFDPFGSATWYIVEGQPAGDDGNWCFFGWCDLGLGMGEWGYVTLADFESLRRTSRRFIERDLYWVPGPVPELAQAS